MKGRKLNIIFNLSTLILVLIFSAVGVWSATTHVLDTSATVSFTATGISGTISGTVSGLTSSYNYNETSFSPTSSTNETFNMLPWTIGSAGTPAEILNTAGNPSDLVFAITIGNSTGNPGMKVQISSLINGGFTLVGVTQKANGSDIVTDVSYSESLSVYTMTTITSTTIEAGSSILYITFRVPNASVSIGGAISFSIAISKA